MAANNAHLVSPASTVGMGSLNENDVQGAFARTASVFRNFIEKGGKYEPETGKRYWLYISYACPWANRCLAMLKIKGLEDVIGLSVVHPTWGKTKPDDASDPHYGWVFAESDGFRSSPNGSGSHSGAGSMPDPHYGVKTIRSLYEDVAGATGLTKYTVPILFDLKTKAVVNNESSEIVRMLNTVFNEWAKYPERDVYPEQLRTEIDSVMEWIYPTINNGVYRCGFAKTQEAYELAFDELFQSLDRCEEILSKRRYIAGDIFTEADLHLFMTLIRFDEVYVVYFKCNKQFLREYPSIFSYIHDIYQTWDIGATINMHHIKTHYFTSHPVLNTYAIVPKGQMQDYSKPHNRARL